jgi:protein O-mannosyl-transferase
VNNRWAGKALLLILLVYGVLYYRVAHFGFVADDVPEIAESATLDGSFSAGILLTQNQRQQSDLVGVEFPYNSYRPVVFVSQWLEYQVWGKAAGPMHIVNVVLGAIVVILTMWLVTTWTRSAGIGIWAAAIAALHPLQVEAVAYLSARGDLLATIFALSCGLFTLHAAKSSTRWTRVVFVIAATLCYLLSILSKETCLGLPLLLIAMLWSQVRGEQPVAGADSSAPLRKGNVAIVAWQLVAPLAFLVIRSQIDMASASPHVVSALWRLPSIFLAFIKMTLLPFDISYSKMYRPHVEWVAWLLVLVAVAGAVFFWKRYGLTQSARLFAAGMLWFALFLGPAAMGVGAFGALAGRYMFSPIIGLAVATGVVGQHLRSRVRAIVLIPWALMAFVVAWKDVAAWENPYTLALHSAQTDPENSRALSRLGVIYANEGKWPQAMVLLEKAVKIDDTNRPALSNLGLGYLRNGRFADAELALQKAVSVDPAAFRAWYNLGLARMALGKKSQGCEALQHTLAIYPIHQGARALVDSDCR